LLYFHPANIPLGLPVFHGARKYIFGQGEVLKDTPANVGSRVPSPRSLVAPASLQHYDIVYRIVAAKEGTVVCLRNCREKVKCWRSVHSICRSTPRLISLILA